MMNMKNRLKIILMTLVVFVNPINAQNKVLLNDSMLVSGDSLPNRSRSIDEAYLPVMPTVTYPTPSSMAFQKYLGYPVSPATGLVDINIPIFEFKEKFISIDLQLKYHSSGIKVQDTPGVTGYGWTLQPGLKISRTVMGKLDEYCPVKNLSSSPNLEELINMATPASRADTQERNIPGENARSDGQYDLFTVFLPHRSATFILKYNSNAYYVEMVPESPLIIEPLMTPSSPQIALYGFKVTDELGITYFFGEESHKTWSQNPMFLENKGFDESIVGWMIRKIVQPNGGDINFTYIQNDETEHYPVGHYHILDNFESVGALGPVDFKEVFFGHNGYLINYNYNYNPYFPVPLPIYSKNIASISSNNQEIVFSYSNDNGVKFLNTITAKDKLSNNNVKSIYLMHTNYFLSEVEVSGMGKYRFNYYPSVSNKGFDWWGYYNGTVLNTGIPNNMQIQLSNAIVGYTYIGTDNREPNESAMTSGTLQKITYPTGGNYEIEYESHRANFNGVLKYVGGLRVKRTKLYDPVSNKTIIKTYTYDKPQFTKPGYPTPEGLIKTSTLCFDEYYYNPDYYLPIDRGMFQVRSRVVTPFSQHAYFSANDCPVWYEKITETNADGGKTIYTYEYCPPDGGVLYNYDVHGNAYPKYVRHLLYTAPRLLTMTHYKNNTKVQMVKHTYSSAPLLPSIQGWIVVPVKRISVTLQGNGCCNSDFLTVINLPGHPAPYYYSVFINPISHMSYNIDNGTFTLSSTETRTYSNNDSIVELISYTYDPTKKYNMKSKTVTTNTGDIREKYYYPYDNNSIPNKNILTPVQQTNITLMDQKNYKTTVVQQTLEKLNSSPSPLFSKITGFMQLANTPNLFLPETDYFQSGSNPFEARIRYHSYDSYGNPKQVFYENGPNISYLWGYNGQYPIAKIENAANGDIAYTSFEDDYSGSNWSFSGTTEFMYAFTGEKSFTLGAGSIIKTGLTLGKAYIVSYWSRSGQLTLSGSTVTTGHTVNGWTYYEHAFTASSTTLSITGDGKTIDELRLYPAGALMSTYTYKPLVGMTSETDPAGQTILYEYDPYGQLKYIKDMDGKKLNQYEYNYAQ